MQLLDRKKLEDVKNVLMDIKLFNKKIDNSKE